AVQQDGKILIGGLFSTLGGGGTGATARSRIGRFNVDGSLDATFDPGANFDVRAIAVQPDGKVLVAGFFTRLGGGGLGTTGRNFGRGQRRGTTGRQDPRRRQLHDARWRRVRYGDARSHRPAQPRRIPRRQLRSRSEWLCEQSRVAGRWTNPRRRRISLAGRP